MCALPNLSEQNILHIGCFVNVIVILGAILPVVFGLQNIALIDALIESGIYTLGRHSQNVTIAISIFTMIIGLFGILVTLFGKWSAVLVHCVLSAMIAIALFVIGSSLISFPWARHSDLTLKSIKTNYRSFQYLLLNSTSVDPIQNKFQCCGMRDWKDYIIEGFSDITLPDSCCQRNEEDYFRCSLESPSFKNKWTSGCTTKIMVNSFVSYTETKMLLLGLSLPVAQTCAYSGLVTHYLSKGVF